MTHQTDMMMWFGDWLDQPAAGMQGMGPPTDLQQGMRRCLLHASATSLLALLLIYLYLNTINTDLQSL